MNCRSKKSIKSILGIAAAVMLLVGCGGSDIESRTEDTEKDDDLQLQQNIEEQDRAETGSEEQPEQSGQSGQQGQPESKDNQDSQGSRVSQSRRSDQTGRGHSSRQAKN